MDFKFLVAHNHKANSYKTGNVRINIILKHVYVTIIVMVKHSVLHILSVSVTLVIQRAQRMPHTIVIHGLYHILPHFLINGMIFQKKLLDIKCVF
jgi:hypothetical protein